jgi:hypothetical protein
LSDGDQLSKHTALSFVEPSLSGFCEHDSRPAVFTSPILHVMVRANVVERCWMCDVGRDVGEARGERAAWVAGVGTAAYRQKYFARTMRWVLRSEKVGKG